jgi:GT2 family glycosyltransferase
VFSTTPAPERTALRPMGTVSAIVPTFNRAHLIAECLESLLRQTRPLAEIIVVNDGSTDKTLEVLQGYAGRVQVINQNNAGKAAALNRALAESHGDYIWICDDDDVAEPDACANLAGALDNCVDSGFAYGRFQCFSTAGGVREAMGIPWPVKPAVDLFLALAERCFIFQFSSMVRRATYQTVGQFDETLLRSQDYDMSLRVARRHKGTFVPKLIYWQRQHSADRGPFADHFSADLIEYKSIQYGQVLFRRLLPTLSQDELTPTFAKSWAPELRQRAAALQLTCIAGRQGLWVEALDALDKADFLSSTVAALPEELAIAARILAEQRMVGILITDCCLCKRLTALLRRSTFCKSIAPALAVPLFWQVRNCATGQNLTDAWRRLKLLVHIVGLPHTIRRGAARLETKARSSRFDVAADSVNL